MQIFFLHIAHYHEKKNNEHGCAPCGDFSLVSIKQKQKKTYLLRNHICAQLERNIERHDFNLNLDFLIEISASNLLFSYDNL